MRPRWLRGWRIWVDARPTGDIGDRRPLLERMAAYIGIRRDW